MGEEEVVFVRRASGLVRELTWFDVAIWSLATPAASGMTYYAVKMVGSPDTYGGNIALAFFLAGLVFLPLIIVFYYVSASYPRSSSIYVVTSRILHPILGYLPTWLYIVVACGLVCGFMMFIGLKALNGPLVVAGLSTGNKALIDLANAAVDPKNMFIVSIILVIVLWALNIGGIKVIKWVMRIATLIPLVVTVATLIAIAIQPPGSGVIFFNNVYGSGVAEKIMEAALKEDVAKSYGIEALTPTSLWLGTYGMLLWTLWAWTGLEITTFVGSEVKDPSKSYMRGLIIGYLLVMALYVFNGFILPYVFNYDFLAAYSYLKYNHPEVLDQILGGKPAPDASVPFYLSLIYPNPVVAMLIGLAYFLWYLNTAIPCWVAAIRGFFAFSFDRVHPEKLAEVSPRFAAPTWANHVTAILGFLGVILTYFEHMGSTMAAVIISLFDFTTFILIWPLGLAIALLPWLKPEFFERTVFRSKIGATILGIIVFGVGWWLMLYTAYYDPLLQILNATIVTIAVIIYAVMIARNRARGIDPLKIYGQIPPA